MSLSTNTGISIDDLLNQNKSSNSQRKTLGHDTINLFLLHSSFTFNPLITNFEPFRVSNTAVVSEHHNKNATPLQLLQVG